MKRIAYALGSILGMLNKTEKSMGCKWIILLLIIFTLGCATNPWIDADNCKVRANMVKAGIETQWPEMPTKLVYGYMGKKYHVELMAFVGGEWKFARMITFCSDAGYYRSSQIVFYKKIWGFTMKQGEPNG